MIILINNPVFTEDYAKKTEKINLSRKSNGLGFFVMSYFLTMFLSSVFLELLLTLLLPDAMELSNLSPEFFLMEIFISVLSAFIPSLLYIIFSKSDINEIIMCRYVKLNVLIPIVLIGMGAAMFANRVSELVTENFSLFGIENNIDFSSSTSSIFGNILYIISTAVVPALAEEFAFRGIVMGSLRKYGDVFAIIVSSVMFGAMHGNIVQIPFAFVLGLIFAYVDCKTNSIVPSIIIHFINNFYAVIMDILLTESIIGKSQYYILSFSVAVLFCILGLIAFVVFSNQNKQFFKISDKNDSGNMRAKSLSLKEKNIAFFTSPGVIASIVLFLFETVFYLVVL